MDKLTSIRIKYNDGTYLDQIPIEVLVQNVGYDSSHNLLQVLGTIDVDSDGTIQAQINKLFNEKVNSSDLDDYVNNQISTNVTQWLTANVTPTGSAVMVDQSLSISGAAADAKVAGDRLMMLTNCINSISPDAEYTWRLKKNYDGVGNLVDSRYMAATTLIEKNGKSAIYRTMPLKDANNVTLLFYVTQFDSNGTWLGRSVLDTEYSGINLSDDCDKFAIAIGRTSRSNIEIQQADIDNYFSAIIALESVSRSQLDQHVKDIDASAILMRGRITDLGYTSFGSCTKPGVYVFTSSDSQSITDAPDGLVAGGQLVVSKNGSRIWQEISNNTDSYIRYGTTSVWYKKHKSVYVRYTEGAESDNSVERIDVDIPTKNKGDIVRYAFGHCVNATANADVWRIMYMYHKAVNTDYTPITRKGEFECAVHLKDRDDFSGGIVHGDEVVTSIHFFMDGTETLKNNCIGQCAEFKIVRFSDLYDPADHSTVIAKHGVEYIFTTDKLTIRQSVKWTGIYELTNCYLAMLPILKTFSKYRYDNINFDIVANPNSGLSEQIPKASSVTEYNKTTSVTMSIDKYPSGLTGGDVALITDNGGLPYNKVYFVVCSTGTTEDGELWQSETQYIVK